MAASDWSMCFPPSPLLSFTHTLVDASYVLGVILGVRLKQ